MTRFGNFFHRLTSSPSAVRLGGHKEKKILFSEVVSDTESSGIIMGTCFSRAVPNGQLPRPTDHRSSIHRAVQGENDDLSHKPTRFFFFLFNS